MNAVRGELVGDRPVHQRTAVVPPIGVVRELKRDTAQHALARRRQFLGRIRALEVEVTVLKVRHGRDAVVVEIWPVYTPCSNDHENAGCSFLKQYQGTLV